MEDFDASDDEKYESERRKREIKYLKDRFERIGFEKGLSIISKVQEEEVQQHFNDGFTTAARLFFKASAAFSELKSLEIDNAKYLELKQKFEGLIEKDVFQEDEIVAFIRECESMAMDNDSTKACRT